MHETREQFSVGTSNTGTSVNGTVMLTTYMNLLGVKNRVNNRQKRPHKYLCLVEGMLFGGY